MTATIHTTHPLTSYIQGREKKQQQDGTEPQYRDRAKERRDGTNRIINH